MFGCHSLFAKENIFALIWKEGQIGVKIPDAESYQEILALKGAKPWKAGNRQMAHWVLLPDSVQGNSAKLAKWVGLAHGLAMRVVPKVKKKSLLKKP